MEFPKGTRGSRCVIGSSSWYRDGNRMMCHKDGGPSWPPFRPCQNRDPQFRLLRMGVFPSSSPSGDRLLSNNKPAAILRNSILVMNPDGSKLTVLFEDAEKSALAPVWSPMGDKIAFGFGQFFQTVKGPAIADIAVIGSDGKGLKLLTNGKGNHGFPSWSPNGGRIVYLSPGGKTSGLFILEIETGTPPE